MKNEIEYNIDRAEEVYAVIEDVVSCQDDTVVYNDRLHRILSDGKLLEFDRYSLMKLVKEHVLWVTTRVDDDGSIKRTPMNLPYNYVDEILTSRWESVRKLRAVVNTLVVRDDGSIATQKGYDEKTQIFLTRDWETVEASDELIVSQFRQLFAHFPFENEQAFSATLALILTPLMHRLYEGPSPLFLIDAAKRGSGKTLLGTTALTIANGGVVPSTATWPKNEEEQTKTLTARALHGTRTILLDNVVGVLGGEALNAVLTSTRYVARKLGSSTMVDVEWRPIIVATGNNCELGDDMGRRTITIRLVPNDEFPENRELPDILADLKENSDLYVALAAALIVNWFEKGKPHHKYKKMGSFEGWSDTVRSCLASAGLADPLSPRAHKEREEGLSLLLALEEATKHTDKGATAADLVGRVDMNKAPLLADWCREHGLVRGNASPSAVGLGRRLAQHVDAMYEGARIRKRVSAGRIFYYIEREAELRPEAIH